MRECFFSKCLTVFCANWLFCLAVLGLPARGSKRFGNFGSDNVKCARGENCVLLRGRGAIGVGVERSA
uniref:Secreted protein n=1 Tax=Aegilops tauschii subsp. strangulata TaxID=200361 RepID=A0A453S8T0_AEGTS